MGKYSPIYIEVDDREVRRRLWGLQKHAPFALARAINEVGTHALEFTRATLKTDMILRDSRSTPGAIRQRFASAKRPIGEIGTFREVLATMVTGGQRPGHGDVATEQLRGGPNKPKKTTVGSWPKRLIKSGRAFLVGSKSFYSVRERFASGAYKPGSRNEARLRGTRALYIDGRKVRIRPMWQVEKRVHQAVARYWERTVSRAVEYAIKTAR